MTYVAVNNKRNTEAPRRGATTRPAARSARAVDKHAGVPAAGRPAIVGSVLCVDDDGEADRRVADGGVTAAGARTDSARSLLDRGEIHRAINAATRSVAAQRALDAPEQLATALAVAAESQAEAGHLDTAVQLATEGVAIAQANGDFRVLALACRVLGELHGRLGQLSEAAGLLAQALKASVATDDHGGHAEVLDALCRNTLRQAERASRARANTAAELFEDAVEYGRRALAAAQQVEDPGVAAACAASLALALLRRGEIDEALTCLRGAAALVPTLGLRLLQVRFAVVEAEAMLAQGNASDAVRRLRGLVVTCADAPLIEHDAQRTLYRGAKMLGEFELALAAHERCHELDAQLRTEVAQARARVLINEIETQNARLEADKARLEAELLRVKSRRLESEKRALEAHARELGRHARQDALTGLWNRRYIDDVLPRMLSRAREGGAPLAVAVGDIDRFKRINDTYGHPTGDQVLCAVADLLRDNCRPTDTVARVGGEEFLLVLQDTDPRGARPVCERLRRAVEKHRWSEIAPGLEVTISFGFSDSSAGAQARDLLASADENLYAAKRGGRNRVEPQPR
jgi:diguanylate cyclase (GGDEF)-like protein